MAGQALTVPEAAARGWLKLDALAEQWQQAYGALVERARAGDDVSDESIALLADAARQVRAEADALEELWRETRTEETPQERPSQNRG